MRPPGKRWPGRENRLIRETLAAWAAALRDFPLPALRRSCLWGKSKKDICRGRAQCSGPGSSNKRIRSWLRTIYPYSLESFISIFEYSGCHVVLLYKQRFIPPLCKTGAIGATAHNSWTKPLRGGNGGSVVVLKSRCDLAPHRRDIHNECEVTARWKTCQLSQQPILRRTTSCT
jgi:hypothetical protein